MDSPEQLFYVTVAFLFLLVVVIVQYYSAPDIFWHVKLDMVLALVTSFSVVALVPFDVYTTLQGKPNDIIPILWSATYWTTQALTWLVLPVHQVYADAGDFTVLTRLRTAVHENFIFYAVLGVVGFFALVFLLVFEHFSLN
ncbi:hypothetical protein CYMTET_52424, partial [Cymbomonas tetramitiformis]